ncbi:MAG: hypothetical protein COZ06_06875 [Armatimonadetes bacterium CG_4_10_14_3_um_filter_66_18]|nr:hypothetical protein [Armatimonadota bacterium]OIP07374.1 MAG: hypothetical protein AUJ96_07520 [Armatimonadetes bacterium CG2_30_66_41]PIX41821.1 MAG: hypothetical protein COZ57_22600 [Armatimonadetes bacterium CG_4_8_14_3_um_filter_66_20]PIY50909.1 MAG: hypothetical protein COZ06_06875 [Armatimonadetes bacterium CG_4_10_14_3_um_filter_66_18]
MKHCTLWHVAALLALVAPHTRAESQKLLPWQQWVEVPADTQARPEIVNDKWQSTGGKEGTLAVSRENGPWGAPYFRFTVKVDHLNEGAYPQGWPAFQWTVSPALDFTGGDAVRYWVRVESKLDRPFPLRFILHTDKKGVINEPIKTPTLGRWVQATHDLRGKPALDKVTLLHFFLCENEYKHGDEMTFDLGGFELCKLKREVSKLPPDEAAVGLWVGKRADTSEQAVIVDQGTKTLPVLAVVGTGANRSLRADDELRFRFREVFSKHEQTLTGRLGQDVPPESVGRVEQELPLPDLPAGYYLATVDLTRAGKSTVNGRVGCDDLYVRKPDERMAYTVLSIRTAMALWVRDLLYGDVMCGTRIALPHTYDPLAPDTYADFLRVFALTTGKHTEGNEAGDTGLVYAAEAFRKSGDTVRCQFAEWLLQDSLDHMVAKMQAPCGAAITWSNELVDHGLGSGGPSQAFGSYDSNQIGEWLTPFARAIVYFHTGGGDRDYAAKLNAAARKAADYIADHSLQESDGIPNVVRHLGLTEKPDGTVQQRTYHQEGRQCDVYLGRALSGLSYYAYAMQLLGDKVPDHWWSAFDNTVKWCQRKMKPNGWFDWQCEDVVEGGCHTFLGNLYVAEGLFGCYLADRQAGRTAEAEAARAAALKAYHYVTDDCYVRGQKYEYPLEFWGGPYVYWLFTEYQAAAGPDARMQDWLDTLHRKWAVQREWKDFLQRGGPGLSGRCDTNGMLAISILGYLGIREMEESGKPFRYSGFPE